MSHKVIQIEPDAPAIMAQRIVRRLVAERWIVVSPRVQDQFAELIADELHQCALEGTLGGKP